MSKANRSFVQADEAVSPVIGVILMVAITVVLAAVVFVLVSNLSKGTGEANEAASVTLGSPETGIIYLTLVKEGANGNYTVNSTVTPTPETIITVDGNSCDVIGTPQAANEGNITGGDNNWTVGETIKINNNCAGAALVAGTTHFVSVTLHGTLVLDNAKVVIN